MDIFKLVFYVGAAFALSSCISSAPSALNQYVSAEALELRIGRDLSGTFHIDAKNVSQAEVCLFFIEGGAMQVRNAKTGRLLNKGGLTAIVDGVDNVDISSGNITTIDAGAVQKVVIGFDISDFIFPGPPANTGESPSLNDEFQVRAILSEVPCRIVQDARTSLAENKGRQGTVNIGIDDVTGNVITSWSDSFGFPERFR